MKAIADQIKAAPTFLVSDELFSEILVSYKNKHPENFTEFKQEFEAKYLEAPERKSLPVLVHLSRSYIHQDNIHALFLLNLDKGGRDLFALYVKHMEQYLKHPNTGLTTAFYSPDNFQNDLSDRVKVSDPFMFELLQRPNLVAEAIILSAKKHKDVKNSEDLKNCLAPFFFADRIRFRDLAVLYGLNMIDIFRFSFMKLSILRQIIMKVSGKYESHYKKFDEFIEGSFNEINAPLNKKQLRDTGETIAEPIRRKPGFSNKPTKSKEDRARKTIQNDHASTTKKQDKDYSRSEQDSAWRNFSDTLKH